MADYSMNHPCEIEVGGKPCGAGTVFVHIAAPGTGCGWSCENGHYDGTCRELTIEDVI